MSEAVLRWQLVLQFILLILCLTLTPIHGQFIFALGEIPSMCGVDIAEAT